MTPAVTTEASPSGTVEVTYSGGGASGAFVCFNLVIGGEAVCAIDAARLLPGTYTLKAAYSGNSEFKSSKSPGVTLTVSEMTRTAISLSAPTATYGSEQRERISVTVTPQVRSTTVSGTVRITASGRAVCTIQLTSDTGSCTLSRTTLPRGTYSVTAAYAGTTIDGASTSTAATLRITG